MIPVATNDVAFSAHAVLNTAITVFLIAMYEVHIFLSKIIELIYSLLMFRIENCPKSCEFLMLRGSKKGSKIAFGILLAVLLSGAICFFIALPQHRWLWLVFIFKYVVSLHFVCVFNVIIFFVWLDCKRSSPIFSISLD